MEAALLDLIKFKAIIPGEDNENTESQVDIMCTHILEKLECHHDYDWTFYNYVNPTDPCCRL